MANVGKKDTRMIFGELHISVAEACKYLGCCRSTMDFLLAKARAGLLKPSFSWYRDKPRSPIWICKASFEDWAKKRMEMHV